MKKIYLHPLPVRIWHWVNAASFLILIVTGLQIRFREFLGLMKFRNAVDLHNAVGFLIIFNFAIWLVYYLFTRKIKIYLPPLNARKFIRGSIEQARYYGYGIFVGEPNPHHSTPENKFNPMQKTAYLAIMLLFLPLQMVSGLMLWKVKSFEVWINFVGGIKVVDTVHVLLFLFFSSFLFVHVYLATLGNTPLEHVRAMITGYEETEDTVRGH